MMWPLLGFARGKVHAKIDLFDWKKRRAPCLQGSRDLINLVWREAFKAGYWSLSQIVNQMLQMVYSLSPRALAAQMRPPLATLPSSEPILSTDFKRRSRSFSMLIFGSLAITRAAMPET